MFKIVLWLIEVAVNWHTWAGLVLGAVIGATTLKKWYADVIAEGKKALGKV